MKNQKLIDNQRKIDRERRIYEATKKRFQLEADKFEELNDVKLDVKALVNAYKVFSKQGHSGFSANYAIEWIYKLAKKEDVAIKSLNGALEASKEDPDDKGMQCLITNQIYEVWNCVSECNIETKLSLSKLLNNEPLTPLTGEDDEWVQCTNCDGSLPKGAIKEYRNKRCSGIYKVVYPGEPNNIEIAYDLYAKNYSDNGVTAFTTNSFGRQQIVFPYTRNKKTQQIYEIYKDGDDNPPFRTYFINDPETIRKIEENYRTSGKIGCVVEKEKTNDCDNVEITNHRYVDEDLVIERIVDYIMNLATNKMAKIYNLFKDTKK